jgi:mannan endo-1,4-beta-mannosidase
VVRLAEKHGLFLQLALTNNWNPFANANAPTDGSARNTLSNDYGGMDAYGQAFSNSDTFSHDEFYTNPAILNAFLNYTTQIVSRYVNSPAVFGWELANDPRCNSTFPASSQCNTNTITLWHSQVATHVRSIDPNHLITSGNNGDFCVDCPKLFPRVAPPAVSPAVGRRSKPMTKKRLLQERKAAWKRSLEAQERSSIGPRIRGRWHAPETRRQFDVGVGPSFDGSSGVDTEDIINIPEIGYGSFQLFPDQNNYGPTDPNLPAFNNTVQLGLSWIQNHADVAQVFNKPVVLTAFGLVTQNNAAVFVPFNSTLPPFGNSSSGSGSSIASRSLRARQTSEQNFGVDDSQRDNAYAQWLQTGLQSGLGGLTQDQWSQGNLTTGAGTVIQPVVTGTAESPVVTGNGESPNDGYGLQGQGQASAIAVLSEAQQAFGT